jgi:hypothetical protein
MSNKEEIQKIVDEKNNTDPGWLCPLDKKNCQKDCWCFQDAYVREHEYSDNCDQAGFRCINAMFGC